MTGSSTSPENTDESTIERGWPAYLPHREIDALLTRLEQAEAVDPVKAARLLRLVAKEAQRLRDMALRLATEKLAEADHEAREIVADALDHADAMRSAGLAVLNTRLDESDRLIATVREAFRVELRAAEFGSRATDRRNGTRIDDGAGR